MAELWAVDGDPDSDGGGGLKANTGDSATDTVFVNGKNVIVGTTDAYPDSLAPLSPHDNPQSSGHSSTVFAYGKPSHRNNDTRTCGALTIVIGQSTVFVG
jgi:uncharacterized Zn-binding protein involved in type VI secretion